METKKIVFIACSSRNEIASEYIELASSIAKIFIENNYELAFGGASTGMMGQSFQEFKATETTTYAYTTEKHQKDLNTLRSTFGYIYPNTFQKTECLYNKADIILVLPGGTGTLSELFACIEENRTTATPKQIILYNHNHYFDKVIDLIYYCVTNKFNDETIYNFFKICKSEDELKELLNPTKEIKALKPNHE